jgi:hypothetical protein
MVDTTRIHALVARARRRLRLQAAMETATTSVPLAAAAALAAVYAVRVGWVGTGVGVGLLLGSLGIVVGGGLVGLLRGISDQAVAQRIDRFSGLADRLGTACSFEAALSGKRPQDAATGDLADAETRAFMEAAIRDAVAAAPRADVVASTRFQPPRDLRPAAAFAGVSLLVAGLGFTPPARDPVLRAVAPAKAPREAALLLRGGRLCGPGVDAASEADRCGTAKGDAVLFHQDGRDIPALIRGWSPTAIEVVVPAELGLGPAPISVRVAGRSSTAVPFEVVDPRDRRFHADDAVSIEEDDLDYIRDLVKDLRRTAQAEADPALDDYAKGIEQLLAQAERGELTKEKLLDEMNKLDEKYRQEGSDPSPDETAKDMAETGKELEKNPLTKELGKALQKGEMEKAKEELEKLADKLDKDELTEQQKQELAKSMEKAAKAFEQKEEKRDQAQQQKIADTKEAIRKLEDKQKQAKSDVEKQDAERRLDQKKRELKKLEKEKQDREESAQKRRLKRLHRNMDKAAKEMADKKQDKQQQQQQNRQASKSMRDVAEETGGVEKDQRKQATEKKVASQMEDLKEAMRRAKRKGNRGPKDLFGKNNRNRDFEQRARGQKGSGQGWKPGQGQGQGQGLGPGQGKGQQPGGDGQQPGGDSYGTGHDPDLLGDSTAKSGNTTDEGVQGVQGKDGSSRKETILSAAQKGFASAKYRDAYTDYKQIIEEVMRAEKVPNAYKFYVKKYFQKIKPQQD